MKQTTRIQVIDCMKGLLVLGMLFGHCIQFFGDETIRYQQVIVNFINLITFSGFVFAFGYVCNKSYFEKQFKTVAPKMLMGACKMLAAYYLSSVFYVALFEKKIFKWGVMADIICLRKYAGWSEFLVAFFLFYLVATILFPLWKRMNGIILIMMILIAILSCQIPYESIKTGKVALLMGSTHFVTFPILQYMIWFAVGIFVSKKNWHFHPLLFGGSFLASLPAVVFYITYDREPLRFPPSATFLLGSTFFLYLYFILSFWMDHQSNRVIVRVKTYLAEVGRKSLLYLLFSNLLIFAFAGSAFAFRSINYVVIFFGMMIASIRFFYLLANNKN